VVKRYRELVTGQSWSNRYEKLATYNTGVRECFASERVGERFIGEININNLESAL
jgi:hypothetical protein